MDRLRRAVEDAKSWMRRHYPDFHTPFLQQCFDYLCVDHGLPMATNIDNGMTERMHLSYFPNRSGGTPVFDGASQAWDIPVGSSDVLGIDIYADGRFVASPGDDDCVCIETAIKCPEEIGELLYLIETLNEARLADGPDVLRPLSSILKSLTILVPFGDQYALVSPKDLAIANPSVICVLALLLGNECTSDSWAELSDYGFTGWESWFRENVSLPLSPCQPASWTDICIFTPQTGFTTYRRWLAFGSAYRDLHPPIAFTLARDACSAMFLRDWFNGSDRGNEQLLMILKHWQTFGRVIESMTVQCPPTLLGQIRQTVESRSLNGRVN